ncbi:MAG: enoyl-CoA hydratase/isomerase family protein [Acidobacteria bacterium]|nr:enoyl-CoA hydratase/isomerase family protein [Acidobacteriota bacterium]
MTQSFTRILYESADGIAKISLNRPDKRNALDDATIQDLKDAFERVASDVLVRVVVLRSSSADFCAGADLSALQKIAESSILENRDDARSLMDLFVAMRRLPKPIVAAVRGRALAGGAGLATACDIVIASKSAQFGYPEVRLGFVPAMVMAMLRRSVSEKIAFELVARGEAISADRAAEIGLVNRVVADDDFNASVSEYVTSLARSSASAIALSKYLLYQIDGMTFDAAISSGADLNAVARLTDDCKRGIARFLEKE